jgi:hypothetical protein
MMITRFRLLLGGVGFRHGFPESNIEGSSAVVVGVAGGVLLAAERAGFSSAMITFP